MASTAIYSSQNLLGKLLFLGDFNNHRNIPSDRNTLKLNDILGGFRLKPHVGVPTHINGSVRYSDQS